MSTSYFEVHQKYAMDGWIAYASIVKSVGGQYKSVHCTRLSSVHNKMLGKINYALLLVFLKTMYMSKSKNLFPKKNTVAAGPGRLNALSNVVFGTC